MYNLFLDPTTNDIALTGYQLRTTVDNSELVSQKLTTILRTFAGEWFLDNSLGIPYFTRILIKKADLNDVNSLFIAAISTITEIEKILSFTTTFDSATRKYSVDFSVQITDGSIIEQTGVII